MDELEQIKTWIRERVLANDGDGNPCEKFILRHVGYDREPGAEIEIIPAFDPLLQDGDAASIALVVEKILTKLAASVAGDMEEDGPARTYGLYAHYSKSSYRPRKIFILHRPPALLTDVATGS